MSAYRYVGDYKLFEEYLKEFPDHIQKYAVSNLIIQGYYYSSGIEYVLSEPTITK